MRFREIASGDDVAYFVKTDLVEDPVDFENSILKLWVTDGTDGWESTGLRRPAGGGPADWMRRVHTALSQGGPEYSYKVKRTGDDLKISCSWTILGVKGNQLAHVTVGPSEDPSALRISFLKTLVLNDTTLQGLLEESRQHCERFRHEAEIAQKMVAEYVEKREEKEDELYVKFAALLNEKKAKTLEWKEKAEEWEKRALAAEERLSRGDFQDPGAETGDETEVEDDADSAATEVSDAEDAMGKGNGGEAEVRSFAGHDAMETKEATGSPDIGRQLATADTIPLDMDVDLPAHNQPSPGQDRPTEIKPPAVAAGRRFAKPRRR